MKLILLAGFIILCRVVDAQSPPGSAKGDTCKDSAVWLRLESIDPKQLAGRYMWSDGFGGETITLDSSKNYEIRNFACETNFIEGSGKYVVGVDNTVLITVNSRQRIYMPVVYSHAIFLVDTRKWEKFVSSFKFYSEKLPPASGNRKIYGENPREFFIAFGISQVYFAHIPQPWE